MVSRHPPLLFYLLRLSGIAREGSGRRSALAGLKQGCGGAEARLAAGQFPCPAVQEGALRRQRLQIQLGKPQEEERGNEHTVERAKTCMQNAWRYTSQTGCGSIRCKCRKLAAVEKPVYLGKRRNRPKWFRAASSILPCPYTMAWKPVARDEQIQPPYQ